MDRRQELFGKRFAVRLPRPQGQKEKFPQFVRINAGVRPYGMSYSAFMGKLHGKNIDLNRKVLADLAMNHPEAFKAVVDSVK